MAEKVKNDLRPGDELYIKPVSIMILQKFAKEAMQKAEEIEKAALQKEEAIANSTKETQQNTLAADAISQPETENPAPLESVKEAQQSAIVTEKTEQATTGSPATISEVIETTQQAAMTEVEDKPDPEESTGTPDHKKATQQNTAIKDEASTAQSAEKPPTPPEKKPTDPS